MRASPINLMAAFGRDSALSWNPMDVVNWIPTPAEGVEKSGMKLETPPGSRLFAALGNRPIRCLYAAQGKRFAVAGSTLFELSSTGVATVRGTIPGTGRVQASHNQQSSGNEFVFVNGSAGYVWNSKTSTFSKITDESFPGSFTVDFSDQYMIMVEPFGRYWFHSDVANAKEYISLDRAQSEASPDPIVCAVANQGEVIVYNQKTTEFFVNTGATTGTFQSKDIVIDKGCAAKYSTVKMDNSVMWLGHDGIFYRLDGYGATPISTGAIEKAISGYDWSRCYALKVENRHHKIAYWTFPDGETFGYDAVTQLWHRRKSYGLDFWRYSCATEIDRQWLVGDAFNGNVYTLDWDVFDDNGSPIEGEFISDPSLYDDQNAIGVSRVELVFETGGPETAPVVTSPPAQVRIWGFGATTAGVAIDPTQTFNSELASASTVEITGYYTPNSAEAYPPSVDPKEVSLITYTYVPVSPAIALTTGNTEVGVGNWFVASPAGIPLGKSYAVLAIDTSTEMVAQIWHTAGL